MGKPLEFALKFAARGWKLFPQAKTKRPLLKDWPNQATDDPEQIRTWSRQFPKANFAVACGKRSGMIGLDIDVKNGGHGKGSFILLQREHGKVETMTTRTPSGGGHLYFGYPDGVDRVPNLSEIDGFPGIEVKGDGAALTLPGSFYNNGAEYVLSKDSDLAACPEWLTAIITQKSHRSNENKITPDKPIREGGRNNRLTKLAGSMRRQGVGQETIFAALVSENERHCNPPLPRKEVEEIAKSISRYKPETSFHNTDTGNAERLVSLYGSEIRYCDEWGKWLIWDERRWIKDNTRMIRRFAKNTVRKIYIEASQTEDEKDRKNLAKYALNCESLTKIKNMIEASTSEHGIPVRTEDLDQNMMFLNLENGTIDLTTGKLQPHRQEDLITKLCPAEFDEKADCPRWMKFLDRIMAGDQELIFFLQKAVGLSLSGDVSEDIFFFLYGGGENGKTTFLNTIHALLGDYSCRSQIETFLSSRNDSIPNDLAALQGARFVSAIEAKKGRRFDEGRLKMLTGGDPIQARFMRAEFFEFMPQLKLWIAGNNRPVITDTTRGMWRRVRLIPFDVQIPEGEQDKYLEEKLKRELPGILLWALDGCLAWQREGLGCPEAVKKATKEYQEEMDSLSDFITEKLVRDPAARIQSSVLFAEYLNYCEEIGEKKPNTLTWLSLEMKERGFKKERSNKCIFWQGIGQK